MISKLTLTLLDTIFKNLVDKIENEVISRNNMTRDDYEACFNARVEKVPELKEIE